MQKTFNIEGACYPEQHYMVNTEYQINAIEKLIKTGKYFTINRARQSGKTTTLNLLEHKLKDDYIIFFISFEGLAQEAYKEECTFCHTFIGLLNDTIEFDGIDGIDGIDADSKKSIKTLSTSDKTNLTLRILSNLITTMCMNSSKPILLMIDEVDQASGHEIFLSFLGMLRNKYQSRHKRATFQSVILTGVHDIKNLKIKMKQDGEIHYNSPWNIAAEFLVDMNFSKDSIENMLKEYVQDSGIQMDTVLMAKRLYEYTSGYPYLVSYLCKKMDEGISENRFLTAQQRWTRDGFLSAVKLLVKGPNTLYDDMIKHVIENKSLYTMLNNILFKDEEYTYQTYDLAVDIGRMYGFIMEDNGLVKVANRIFETQLYSYFVSEALKNNEKQREAMPDRSQFIVEGNLDMDLVMTKYYDYYTRLDEPKDEKFIENYGRLIFLMYLSPIINGTGNYHIEEQGRNRKRTDVIIDYNAKQYIVELKIWNGEAYHKKGEKQLSDYLNDYRLNRGYLLIYDFRKHKKTGITETEIDGKKIMEVTVG